MPWISQGLRGADKYALRKIYSKAEASLKMMENSLAAKVDKNTVISTARQTAYFSEDARALAVQRQEEERIAKEREDAAAKARTEAEDKAAVEAAGGEAQIRCRGLTPG